MSLMRNISCVLLVVLSLSGCTVLKKPVSLNDAEKQLIWEKIQQQILSINNWELVGRLGLLVHGNSVSVSLSWIQESDAYTIRIDGPFGLSLAHIKGDSTGVTAKVSGEKQPLESTSPEDLIQKITGWYLPVSDLKYWVRGLPAPGSESKVALNDYGQARIIEQGGWSITYGSYFNAKSIALPHRLSVHGDNINLKLVIKDWQMHIPEVVEGADR
ncbi:MAG: lipoprotein insertase outer membrane protein LolB [Candidatus Endonucleobacter bathymodioli]|uniref:Outer-membrane lipoprotein LolB n=1 Tax=Candidatus Endonucleibacter bathymodioli TaxID=539814 RepID=A0AA90SSP5_9GAMM|nr:lipoprotein insertase outer membrane protein LolB [Candidatus Endonucleobacter bathymodioli]